CGLRGDEAWLEVQDGGPGIPVEDLEKVFLPYYTTKDRGTGLGLSIVARIAEDHGGRSLARRREPEGGTAFRIELPLAREPAPTPRELPREKAS
ncbi:MAG: ATP-binding protein, partial [Acidobacteriota bacterium]